MSGGTCLTERERADLRDWYDIGGRWNERMGSLYRAVEAIVDARLAAVEALADEWAPDGWAPRTSSGVTLVRCADALRAALPGDDPA